MQDHWRMSYPLKTHWREAHCREVNCPNYVNGWKTVLPATDLANIAYIKMLMLRYKEERNDPLLITFIFEPGQECFTGRMGQHQVQLERAPFFGVISLGDRRLMEYNQWVDTMDRDLRKIKRIREG